jgi:hypothetical protein
MPHPLASGVRVGLYCDGFNLYHGLHQAFGRRYLWLDLWAMSELLLKPGQALAVVRYFTARVSGEPSASRQDAYLRGLATHRPEIAICEGHLAPRPRRCFACGETWVDHEEKETDVNIAVNLVADAVAGLIDVALVVSADRDLAPAIRKAKEHRPGLRVVSVFPPKRRSEHLTQVSDATIKLHERTVRRAQLPPVIVPGAGNKITRPAYWA